MGYLKYLLDSNIWLEELLNQEKADDVYDFLKKTDSSLLCISEFSLYSIGLILNRLEKIESFDDFVKDIHSSETKVIRLLPKDMSDVIKTIKKFGLGFDDAYQYVAAEKYGLVIVSFDSDFDKTKRGRKTIEDLSDE